MFFSVIIVLSIEGYDEPKLSLMQSGYFVQLALTGYSSAPRENRVVNALILRGIDLFQALSALSLATFIICNDDRFVDQLNYLLSSSKVI